MEQCNKRLVCFFSSHESLFVTTYLCTALSMNGALSCCELETTDSLKSCNETKALFINIVFWSSLEEIFPFSLSTVDFFPLKIKSHMGKQNHQCINYRLYFGTHWNTRRKLGTPLLCPLFCRPRTIVPVIVIVQSLVVFTRSTALWSKETTDNIESWMDKHA